MLSSRNWPRLPLVCTPTWCTGVKVKSHCCSRKKTGVNCLIATLLLLYDIIFGALVILRFTARHGTAVL